MGSDFIPSWRTAGFCRRRALAFAALPLLLATATAGAQSFYQLTNPRIYRVDPPTSNPWDHGYGFGGMAFRPVDGDPNGQVLLVWEAPITELRGDLGVLGIDFATSPNPQGTNDATLLDQVLDWGWCNNMDYESDDRVLVNERFEYSGSGRSPGSGIGRFVRQNGQITGFQMTTPFQSFQMDGGERIRGAFAGQREIAGTTYDTVALTKMATDTSGIFFLDVATGNLIDADPSAPPVAGLSGHPYIGLAGNTGVTNIASPIVAGKSLVAGLDVVGDTAFVLVVLNWQATDQYLAMMQVDLPSKRVLGVANVSQMLNPSRGGQCSGYTQEIDVSPLSDGKVRILIAECTDRTLTSLIAIDGVNVPEGTDPVDPNAIYVPQSGDTNQPDSGNTPSQPGDTTNTDTTNQAIIWVCPGIGWGLPMLLSFVGLGLSARARRPIPPG